MGDNVLESKEGDTVRFGLRQLLALTIAVCGFGAVRAEATAGESFTLSLNLTDTDKPLGSPATASGDAPMGLHPVPGRDWLNLGRTGRGGPGIDVPGRPGVRVAWQAARSHWHWGPKGCAESILKEFLGEDAALTLTGLPAGDYTVIVCLAAEAGGRFGAVSVNGTPYTWNAAEGRTVVGSADHGAAFGVAAAYGVNALRAENVPIPEGGALRVRSRRGGIAALQAIRQSRPRLTLGTLRDAASAPSDAELWVRPTAEELTAGRLTVRVPAEGRTVRAEDARGRPLPTRTIRTEAGLELRFGEGAPERLVACGARTWVDGRGRPQEATLALAQGTAEVVVPHDATLTLTDSLSAKAGTLVFRIARGATLTLAGGRLTAARVRVEPFGDGPGEATLLADAAQARFADAEVPHGAVLAQSLTTPWQTEVAPIADRAHGEGTFVLWPARENTVTEMSLGFSAPCDLSGMATVRLGNGQYGLRCVPHRCRFAPRPNGQRLEIAHKAQLFLREPLPHGTVLTPTLVPLADSLALADSPWGEGYGALRADIPFTLAGDVEIPEGKTFLIGNALPVEAVFAGNVRGGTLAFGGWKGQPGTFRLRGGESLFARLLIRDADPLGAAAPVTVVAEGGLGAEIVFDADHARRSRLRLDGLRPHLARLTAGQACAALPLTGPVALNGGTVEAEPPAREGWATAVAQNPETLRWELAAVPVAMAPGERLGRRAADLIVAAARRQGVAALTGIRSVDGRTLSAAEANALCEAPFLGTEALCAADGGITLTPACGLAGLAASRPPREGPALGAPRRIADPTPAALLAPATQALVPPAGTVALPLSAVRVAAPDAGAGHVRELWFYTAYFPPEARAKASHLSIVTVPRPLCRGAVSFSRPLRKEHRT